MGHPKGKDRVCWMSCFQIPILNQKGVHYSLPKLKIFSMYVCHLNVCFSFSLCSKPQPSEIGEAEYSRPPPPMYGQNIPHPTRDVYGSYPNPYPYIVPYFSPYGQYPIYQGLQLPVHQHYGFFFPPNNFQMTNYIPPQQSPYNFQMGNYLLPQHQWQSQGIPADNGSFFNAGVDDLQR